MKRIHLYVAGIAVALVPAVLGLTGNASFSQSVPVRVPQQAATSDASPTPDADDDRGRRHGGHGADDGPGHDVGDDRGRHGADDSPTRDVDDGDRHRRGENSGHGGGDDDNSGHGGGDDDSSRHGGGDDDSGHGSSDRDSGDDGRHHSGGDDSGGSGGHGSDD